MADLSPQNEPNSDEELAGGPDICPGFKALVVQKETHQPRSALGRVPKRKNARPSTALRVTQLAGPKTDPPYEEF